MTIKINYNSVCIQKANPLAVLGKTIADIVYNTVAFPVGTLLYCPINAVKSVVKGDFGSAVGYGMLSFLEYNSLHIDNNQNIIPAQYLVQPTLVATVATDLAIAYQGFTSAASMFISGQDTLVTDYSAC